MKLAAAVDIYVLHRRAMGQKFEGPPLHSARSLVVTATHLSNGSHHRRSNSSLIFRKPDLQPGDGNTGCCGTSSCTGGARKTKRDAARRKVRRQQNSSTGGAALASGARVSHEPSAAGDVCDQAERRRSSEGNSLRIILEAEAIKLCRAHLTPTSQKQLELLVKKM